MNGVLVTWNGENPWELCSSRLGWSRKSCAGSAAEASARLGGGAVTVELVGSLEVMRCSMLWASACRPNANMKLSRISNRFKETLIVNRLWYRARNNDGTIRFGWKYSAMRS